MEHWLWIILAALCFECKGEDRVKQPTGDVIGDEGDTATLGCTFETSNPSPTLFWYKQEENNVPKYILRRDPFGSEDNDPDFQKDRFNAEINKTSVPLKIQKLQLSDSAVYYCALQPTVTGNTKTLYKNLWSKDNTILHNIHQRETHTVKLQWFVAGSQSPISLMLRRRAVQQTLFSCFILLQWKNTVHLLSDFNNSKDMLLYFFLFLSHFIGLTAGDTISPVKDEVTGREGESVKLTCRYQTTATGVYLYWYKHHSDLEAPQFILWKGAKRRSDSEYIPDNRYESRTSDTSTELTIKSPTLADTALYYCALERVVGSGLGFYPLTFGKAIRLTVTPIDTTPLVPNLFILSPLQSKGSVEGSTDKPGPDVCLATDFRPRGGQMVLNVTDGLVKRETKNAALSLKKKTYFYAAFSDKNIQSCELGDTFSTKEDSEAQCEKKKTTQSSLPDVVEICDHVYPEKAKLNFFLVLMNGVRVVFTKALAFNTVLTIRALLF